MRGGAGGCAVASVPGLDDRGRSGLLAAAGGNALLTSVVFELPERRGIPVAAGATPAATDSAVTFGGAANRSSSTRVRSAGNDGWSGPWAASRMVNERSRSSNSSPVRP
jgi:hypothetical protein